MSIGTAFEVLVNNRADIEDIVAKMGGLDTVLRLSPDIFRILQTVMKSAPAGADPVTASATAIASAQAVLEYSEATKARVAAFQRKNGLAVDGVVGDETWSKVEALLGPQG